ncbi:MAG: hypothetical protein KDC79_08780 [Cyclobacteriaceae bacterium]|nr:hypothetical protein [Cyclobacteriaceae bacterium]
MKAIIKSSKHIAWLLTSIIFFQSCHVYYHASVPVDEATKTNATQFKKLKTRNGKIYKLNSIEVVNGTIYGQRKTYGRVYDWCFKEEDIKSIQLQNVAKSNVEYSATRVEPFKSYITLLYYLHWRMGGC